MLGSTIRLHVTFFFCSVYKLKFYILSFYFGVGYHLAIIRAYSLLCTQQSPLPVHGGPYKVSEIELGPATCKTNALLTILSFHTLIPILFRGQTKCNWDPIQLAEHILFPTGPFIESD